LQLSFIFINLSVIKSIPYLSSKKGMAIFGPVVCMTAAGWQFGIGGTEAPFSEKEVAMENAVKGSGQWDLL